jgi:Uma2 family endonuclease
MSAATPQKMTAAEYLAWEREQPSKHEYKHGEVFAMSGGSPRHNLLAGEVLVQLSIATRSHGCRVLTSDQRVALIPDARYVYPDAAVVCGELKLQPGTTDVLLNPRIVVEVLSRSTEAYDRGEKWEGYQRIASLTDYVLVSQRAVRLEHYQRDTDGSWQYRTLGAGEVLTLSNGATIAIDALFQGAFDYPGDT